MKKILLFILVISLTIVFLLFYSTPRKQVRYEYDPQVGGINQIAEYELLKNNDREAILKLGLAVINPNAVTFSHRVITADEPIYAGEGKKLEPALGPYRVELLLADMRLQKRLVDRLGTKIIPIGDGPEDILQTIKVSYPQDDASLVIYLGCRVKPKVTAKKEAQNLIITLQKEN